MSSSSSSFKKEVFPWACVLLIVTGALRDEENERRKGNEWFVVYPLGVSTQVGRPIFFFFFFVWKVLPNWAFRPSPCGSNRPLNLIDCRPLHFGPSSAIGYKSSICYHAKTDLIDMRLLWPLITRKKHSKTWIIRRGIDLRPFFWNSWRHWIFTYH